MIRVGLTGGVCTGKTTVAEMFSRLGSPVISADDVVHRLLKEEEEVKAAVVSIFGKEVLAQDGCVDRGKLAGIVFTDGRRLRQLTDLLHPRVRLEMRRFFEEREKAGQEQVCVAEVPLLIEGGALELYDVIVVVKANYENQLRRFCQRGGKTRSDLDRRIANQMNMDEKVKFADYVIENDGSVEKTFEQVKNVYDRIRVEGKPRRRGLRGSRDASKTRN